MLTPKWRGELRKQPDTGVAAKQNLTYADIPDTDRKRGHYTWEWAQDKTPYTALNTSEDSLSGNVHKREHFILHWAQENSLSGNEHNKRHFIW